MALVLSQSSASASAKFRPGFNQSATKVATQIGCKNQRLQSNGNSVTKSGLVCDLRGRRINVITFRDIRQQMEWTNGFPAAIDPGYKGHFGYNAGVLIVAKDLNRESAKLGAQVLHGWVWSADSAWD